MPSAPMGATSGVELPLATPSIPEGATCGVKPHFVMPSALALNSPESCHQILPERHQTPNSPPPYSSRPRSFA
eukprot:9501201-Pyramimonas_sp.AAC.1